MNRAPIYILSGPIRTGKTSGLMERLSGKPGVGGFLTPDGPERRMWYNLASGEMQPFEMPGEDTAASVNIGRFRFYEAAFRQMKTLLAEDPALLVVDEVGRLEVHENAGLEPELSAVIKDYKSGCRTGRLLLVVRDTLLEAAILKYGLEEAAVLTALPETFFTD